MVTKKLATGSGHTAAFTWKTIRNGVVANMTDSYAENIAQGIISGVSDVFSEKFAKNFNKVEISIDYSKFTSFQN